MNGGINEGAVMRRANVVGLSVVMMLAGLAWGDATTRPAATQAGESLESMKARLAKLKAEVAALETKIAAAQNADGVSFVKALNGLPAKLRPATGYNEAKSAVRDKWIQENINLKASHTLTGKIISVISGESGKGVFVEMDCGSYDIWGKEITIEAYAVLPSVSVAQAAEWDATKKITVVGPLEYLRVGDTVISVKAAPAKLK